MKKFLGIVYISYSLIIGYAWFFSKLKNFLAPQMQIYAKLSFIPLLAIGIVLLFKHAEFKKSDIILFLPVLLFAVSFDSRLSISLASNKIINKVEIIENDVEPSVEDTYDFSNVDFDVEDSNYDALSNYFITNKNATIYEGKTIRIKGFFVETSHLPNGYVVIGKYLVSCCVADATLTGFIVRSASLTSGWYEIEGVLRKYKGKEYSMYIQAINYKPIEAEDEYINPCYVYDEYCSSLKKYNLKY